MLQNFTYGKKFCAVEHVSVNSQEQIHGLLLIKKKKELVIDSSFEADTLVEIDGHIPSKQHLFLVINTNKVLFKNLDEVLEPLKSVQKAFPNLKLDDFYYETFTTIHKTFVAICRKEDVNTMLDSYKEKQFSVVGFSLGNLSISSLENFVNMKEINTSNAAIQFDDQKVLAITFSHSEKQNLNINGLEVTNTSVLSLAGILTYYTNQSKTTSNFNELIHELHLKFKQQHIFNLGLKISLATIFVLLLFSFLLLTNYTSKIEDLTTTLTINKTQKASLLKLTKEVQKKEKLIQDFSLASSKASWYLDQIGESVPPAINLSEIQWQPLSKSIKDDKIIETEQQNLVIKGATNSGDDFSQWLSLLEQLDWVDKVAINAYGSGKKTNTSFELEITFKR